MPAVCLSVSVDDDSVSGTPNAGKCEAAEEVSGAEESGVLPAETAVRPG